MNILALAASTLFQILLILLLAPLMSGIVKKVKALSQKREGPPIFQLYYDIIKLFSKEMVISTTSSWVFLFTPYIVLASTLSVFLFVPIIPQLSTFSFVGDGFLVIYLLALGKFFLTLSALDTGSTFGGMGSSREHMISSLTEPGFLLSVFTLALLCGSTSLAVIMGHSMELGPRVFNPTHILILMALILILITETSRIPIDDPSTHLELTMIHEAMLLENSGPYLALLELSASIKQLIIVTIIANIFIPFYGFDIGIGIWGFIITVLISVIVYFLKVIIISLLVSFAEVFTVKLRLFATPNIAALSFILAFIAFLQSFILGGA